MTILSVISLIIIRSPQLLCRGVGLGVDGRALSHATDGKKKHHNEAIRFDWQDSNLNPLERRELLNIGNVSLSLSVHHLLIFMILVTRGIGGGRVCLTCPRDVYKSLKVLA